MLPVVALVGRPNVGKSTLFNVLTQSRDALVGDLPGVTRDRHYGICRLGECPFVVVDTGGLADEQCGLDALTANQVRLAIAQSDAVVLLVDARDGLLARDHDILGELRRSGKPVLLAINKMDGLDDAMASAEFAPLGFPDPLLLASAHNRGNAALLQALRPHLHMVDTAAGMPDDADADAGIRVAIIGRPNAGKSTLVNRLLGEERLLVSDQAGTTRDAIHVALERDGQRYTFIDTAGIRRRARTHEAIEKYSVIKAIQSIAAAHVVVVMVDARENLADQDLALIGQVLEQGRALVIACNKWDGMDAYAREQCIRALDRRLAFVAWAKRVFISALHGSGLAELMEAVNAAHAAANRKMTSSQLTRTLENACTAHQPAMVRGHTPKLRYAHPGGHNPPVIVIHGTRTKHITDAYRRYLENTFRKHYRLEGTPVRIEFRDGDNPFAGRRNELTDSQKRKRQRMIRHAKRRARH